MLIFCHPFDTNLSKSRLFFSFDSKTDRSGKSWWKINVSKFFFTKPIIVLKGIAWKNEKISKIIIWKYFVIWDTLLKTEQAAQLFIQW